MCSYCSCKLSESKIILCEEGTKHKLQKLQLNYPRLACKIVFAIEIGITRQLYADSLLTAFQRLSESSFGGKFILNHLHV